MLDDAPAGDELHGARDVPASMSARRDEVVSKMQSLREDYTPGDLGFDPLGMAPKTDAEMLSMKNKELNNARLAMIAVAGIVTQEVITGQELLGSA